ncbi:adenylate/guanylate cyclase domain-containing protein [Saccharopolyspora sp. NPDC049357]|uniref:adenylate/guanylate cyclase domain-containing protein n=1 Tax=Saccharopolyspora sp. NPDC049357 TaxID=3154507 RepID=UPI0034261206
MTPPRVLVRYLPAFLRADVRLEDAEGRVLSDLTQVVVAAVVVLANLIGTVVVLALNLVVIPLPPDGMLSNGFYILAAAAYLLFAALIGVVAGIRGQRGLNRWLASGGPATAQLRAAVLRLPLRVFWLQVWLWIGGAVVFAVFEASRDVERGVWVGVIVVLTGVTTAACAYLLTERLLRPAAARLLTGVDPNDLRVGRGVAVRSVLAWALGSCVPMAGLFMLGLRTLAPSQVTDTQLAVAMVALAGTALVVGLHTVYLAARATADPINGVADALAEVRRGRFDIRIPVYDGTEIGRLQSGFNEMVVGLAEREQIRSAFGTYVDPAIAEHILREGTDLAGEEVEVSIMFIDIRDFTGLSETISATEIVGTINRLFERAVPVIREHGGHVDKFVGDGLLAVFGAPRRITDHPRQALLAALAIAAAVREEFGGGLSVGIGVNTGVVVAGNVGGAGRFEFSVIGDPVNVAARIEAATRQTGDTILISERTRELVADAAAELEERPGVELKGKSEPVSLYAVHV